MSGALRTFLDRFVAREQAPALAARPWGYQLAEGLAGSRTPILLYGSDAAPVAAGAPIWAGSSSGYPYPTADQTIKVKSTSLNDDGSPLGTGAQTIRVWYLDSANAEGTVDVTLDGTNLVVTGVINMRRIQDARVLTVGANGSNAGSISIYQTDGTTLMGLIPLDTGYVTGRGVADGCFQTVPARKRDMITHVGGQMLGVTGDLEWRLMVRSSPTAPWVRRWSYRVGNSLPFIIPLDPPVPIASGSDYGLWAFQGTANVHGTVMGYREVV